MKLTVIKSKFLDNWYVIERAEPGLCSLAEADELAALIRQVCA